MYFSSQCSNSIQDLSTSLAICDLNYDLVNNSDIQMDVDSNKIDLLDETKLHNDL